MNKIRYILQIIFPICVQKEDNTGYALGWGLVCMFPSGSWSDPPLPHHFTDEWPHGSYVHLLYTVYDLHNNVVVKKTKKQNQTNKQKKKTTACIHCKETNLSQTCENFASQQWKFFSPSPNVVPGSKSNSSMFFTTAWTHPSSHWASSGVQPVQVITPSRGWISETEQHIHLLPI